MKKEYMSPQIQLFEMSTEDMLSTSIMIDTTHPGGFDQLSNEEVDFDVW